MQALQPGQFQLQELQANIRSSGLPPRVIEDHLRLSEQLYQLQQQRAHRVEDHQNVWMPTVQPNVHDGINPLQAQAHYNQPLLHQQPPVFRAENRRNITMTPPQFSQERIREHRSTMNILNASIEQEVQQLEQLRRHQVRLGYGRAWEEMEQRHVQSISQKRELLRRVDDELRRMEEHQQFTTPTLPSNLPSRLNPEQQRGTLHSVSDHPRQSTEDRQHFTTEQPPQAGPWRLREYRNKIGVLNTSIQQEERQLEQHREQRIRGPVWIETELRHLVSIDQKRELLRQTIHALRGYEQQRNLINPPGLPPSSQNRLNDYQTEITMLKRSIEHEERKLTVHRAQNRDAPGWAEVEQQHVQLLATMRQALRQLENRIREIVSQLGVPVPQHIGQGQDRRRHSAAMGLPLRGDSPLGFPAPPIGSINTMEARIVEPRQAKEETVYKPDYTHPAPPMPMFTFDFEESEDMKAALPLPVESAANRHLECARCREPLVRTTMGVFSPDEERRKRVWALRCGHVFDGKCLEEITYDASELCEPPTNQSSSRKRKRGVIEAKRVYRCPVDYCGKEHVSWKVEDEWVPADDGRGAIAMFV